MSIILLAEGQQKDMLVKNLWLHTTFIANSQSKGNKIIPADRLSCGHL